MTMKKHDDPVIHVASLHRPLPSRRESLVGAERVRTSRARAALCPVENIDGALAVVLGYIAVALVQGGVVASRQVAPLADALVFRAAVRAGCSDTGVRPVELLALSLDVGREALVLGDGAVALVDADIVAAGRGVALARIGPDALLVTALLLGLGAVTSVRSLGVALGDFGILEAGEASRRVDRRIFALGVAHGRVEARFRGIALFLGGIAVAHVGFAVIAAWEAGARIGVHHHVVLLACGGRDIARACMASGLLKDEASGHHSVAMRALVRAEAGPRVAFALGIALGSGGLTVARVGLFVVAAEDGRDRAVAAVGPHVIFVGLAFIFRDVAVASVRSIFVKVEASRREARAIVALGMAQRREEGFRVGGALVRGGIAVALMRLLTVASCVPSRTSDHI